MAVGEAFDGLLEQVLGHLLIQLLSSPHEAEQITTSAKL